MNIRNQLAFGRGKLNPMYLDGTTFNNGKIVLQFDDGYEDNYTNGFPIFQDKNVSATIFAQTSLVGNVAGGGITWAHLKEMQDSGLVDVECHMHNFGLLTGGTDQQILDDIATMNARFAENGITVSDHLAYPGGDFDDRVIDLVDNYFATGRTTIAGFVDRKSPRYKMNSPNLLFNQSARSLIDNAKATNTAIVFYGHRIGATTTGLYISTADLISLIDYGKSVGCDFITTKELFDSMLYIDCRLSRNCADDAIRVICKYTVPTGYSVSIERSDDDGITYTPIHTLENGDTDFLDTGLILGKDYFYRARGFKGTTYLPYSGVDHASTAITLTVASTGTGAGVATFNLKSKEDVTISLDGNGKFYTNSAGTLGETTSLLLKANVGVTTYIKVTSGTSNLKVLKNSITQINAWTAGTNAPSLGGSLTPLSYLEILNIQGNNTVSGSATHHTNLTSINLLGNTTYGGDVTNAVNLTYINYLVVGALSGNLTNKKLTTCAIAGNGNVTIDITNQIALTYLKLYNTLTINATGSWDNCPLTYFYIALPSQVYGNPKNISGTITYCYLNGCRIVDYTVGGNWSHVAASALLQFTASVGYGLSSGEVDQLIIDVAATKVAGRAIQLYINGANAPRTSVSDAARSLIIADGGVVVTN